MAVSANLVVVRGGRSEPDSKEPPSDAEVLSGIEAGQAWAARRLVDQLEPIVERTLMRVLQRRTSDFEDLVQITFERIIKTLIQRRFDARCSLSTWASAIATHVGIDSLRSKIRERRLFETSKGSLPPEPPSGVDAAVRLEARAEVARIQRVLARMKPAHAEAVLLHDLLGHNLSEIATITGASVAAAQSRLVRGRRAFLRRLRYAAERGRTRS
jgi:RNA polymerase sigma-70 factor (ECF subfamily)